jgi:hypothetical protein
MSLVALRNFTIKAENNLRLRKYVLAAQQQQELAGLRSWWHKLTLEMQKKYLGEHKRSKLKTTTRLPQQSTPDFDPIPPGQDPFAKQQNIAHNWLDHHLKQTLNKHGLGHRILKALKTALIGALLAISMLSNAYAQTPGTFDPNQTIQISEQYNATRIPFMDRELVLKHFAGSNKQYLEELHNLILRPHPKEEDILIEGEKEAIKMKEAGYYDKVLTEINEYVIFIAGAPKKTTAPIKANLLDAVKKIQMIKDVGLPNEGVFLAVGIHRHTGSVQTDVFIKPPQNTMETVGTWKILSEKEGVDTLFSNSNEGRENYDYVYLINGAGTYEVSPQVVSEYLFKPLQKILPTTKPIVQHQKKPMQDPNSFDYTRPIPQK